MMGTRFFSALAAAAALILALAGCGGGSDSAPRVEILQPTNIWPDVYPTVRLHFESAVVTGFTEQPPVALTNICWRSTMGMLEPCGDLKQDTSGQLYVDIRLSYRVDDGNFVGYVTGRGLPVTMVVDQWLLPPKWEVRTGSQGQHFLHVDML